MRIVHFPGHDGTSAEEDWVTELESALSGGGEGAAAEAWRELREDVRALAPPMAADFERELRERIAERGAQARPRRGRLRRPARPAVGAIAAAFSALVVALVIVGPWRTTAPTERANEGVPDEARVVPGVGATAATKSAPASAAGSANPSSGTSAPTAEAPGAALGGPAAAPGRVQQLGASLTLAVTPGGVQPTADRVARLAVRDGGFVQSSRVQVQQGGTGEANIMLRLQSEKLSAALASLERIAPVRDESQSLQDITDSYDAARRRLADVTAERQALLHTLSLASTQGQIDSLRERLSQARAAITSAHSALEALSRRASTAEVEVSVVGDTRAGSEGLTLHRGLHDAARVLTVTLVVLLIAAAVLVPLTLALVALLLATHAWRRHRREHALDVS
jgi:Domain of unknown function (DUF4349)